jgi:hypothetical protein
MTDEVVREKREAYEAISDGSYLALAPQFVMTATR